MRRADQLTTLASENAELCRRYFGRDAQPLLYGLNTRDFPVNAPTQWTPHAPLRIAAIGNDRDRDWETLIKAFGNDPHYTVKLATRRRIPASLRAPNVEIALFSGIKKQHELYDWADLIVVPLRPNSHASGITVMLEAAALGKPMVVTNVGALQDYFAAHEAAYIAPFDPQALRDAADRLAASPADALRQAQAAAAGLLARDLTTQHYAMQHVRITREMLSKRARGETNLQSEAQTQMHTEARAHEHTHARNDAQARTPTVTQAQAAKPAHAPKPAPSPRAPAREPGGGR
jgi:hypothetical protein